MNYFSMTQTNVICSKLIHAHLIPFHLQFTIHQDEDLVSYALNEKMQTSKISLNSLQPMRTFGTNLNNLQPQKLKNAQTFKFPSNLKPSSTKGVSHKIEVDALDENSMDSNRSFCLSTREPLLKPEPSDSIDIPKELGFPKPGLLTLQTTFEESLVEEDDVKSSENPQLCNEYSTEIFTYLRETEDKYRAKSTYLAQQQSINDKMRAILIDWLVDVHVKFQLSDETLHLTTNIIDRYVCSLGLQQLPQAKFQLLGVTAMMIAAKYEEIYAPEIMDAVMITDKTYTREEILEMEGEILLALKFRLAHTSAYRFLQRYAMVHQADEKTTLLAHYLIDLALIEYKMLRYAPSNIAVAALYLACKILRKEAWSEKLSIDCNYTESQLRHCAKHLCALLQHAAKGSLQAVRRKFSQEKYQCIAKIQLDKL